MTRTEALQRAVKTLGDRHDPDNTQTDFAAARVLQDLLEEIKEK